MPFKYFIMMRVYMFSVYISQIARPLIAGQIKIAFLWDKVKKCVHFCLLPSIFTHSIITATPNRPKM